MATTYSTPTATPTRTPTSAPARNPLPDGALALRSVERALDGSLAPATGRRRSRRAAYGPHCPQCAGPLVFGEGCHVCPVCGHSACA